MRTDKLLSARDAAGCASARRTASPAWPRLCTTAPHPLPWAAPSPHPGPASLARPWPHLRRLHLHLPGSSSGLEGAGDAGRGARRPLRVSCRRAAPACACASPAPALLRPQSCLCHEHTGALVAFSVGSRSLPRLCSWGSRLCASRELCCGPLLPSCAEPAPPPSSHYLAMPHLAPTLLARPAAAPAHAPFGLASPCASSTPPS